MTVPVVPVKPALQDTMHPEWSTPVVATNIFKGSVCGYQHRNIQGVFFHWSYPKNHKYGKKLKVPEVGNIILTEKGGGPVDT